MNDNELKRLILAGKKTKPLGFVISPEMKIATEPIVARGDTIVLAMLTQFASDEISCEELFEEGL